MFDAYIYQTQLGELVDLARAFPQTWLVVDHLAGPLGAAPYDVRRAEMFAAWRAMMQELAACPNVFVKLGGLAMPSVGFDFTHGEAPSSAVLADAWRPFIDAAIGLFGPRRCMFESNFPVESTACSYRTLWNAFKRVACHYTAEEQDWLFHDTAASVYGLSGGIAETNWARKEWLR